jgi:hypothetical protein
MVGHFTRSTGICLADLKITASGFPSLVRCTMMEALEERLHQKDPKTHQCGACQSAAVTNRQSKTLS